MPALIRASADALPMSTGNPRPHRVPAVCEGGHASPDTRTPLLWGGSLSLQGRRQRRTGQLGSVRIGKRRSPCGPWPKQAGLGSAPVIRLAGKGALEVGGEVVPISALQFWALPVPAADRATARGRPAL